MRIWLGEIGVGWIVVDGVLMWQEGWGCVIGHGEGGWILTRISELSWGLMEECSLFSLRIEGGGIEYGARIMLDVGT